MSSFFALLDDISVLIKVSAQKTLAILGDDLAINASQSSNFDSKRELKAILEIFKGSIINKIILLPIIFALGYFFPIGIKIFLILGALYLSYEAIEAIYDFLLKKYNSIELDEQKVINNAIKTDFILSIEVIVIAFSTVLGEDFEKQVIVVSLISFLSVFFIYGIVAFIVRLDDIGVWFLEKGFQKTGVFFIKSLEWIINLLSIIGLIAMLLVSGSIFIDNIENFSTFFEYVDNAIVLILYELTISILIGLITFNLVHITNKFILKKGLKWLR